MKPVKNRIQEIDALRGIAALSVVLFHYTMGEGNFLNIGGTGVDLFFIISGFVISLTLANTKKWVDFIVNRLSRLYPTYWFAVTFTMLLHIWNNVPVSLHQYLSNLTMFQNHFGADDLDWAYWTLRVEMVFYAVMLLLYIFKSLRHVEVFGSILLVFVVICNIPFVTTNYPAYHRILISVFPLIIFLPLFLTGIVFYNMKMYRQTFWRYLILAVCFVLNIWLFKIEFRSVFRLDRLQYAAILAIWYLLFILYVNNKLGFLVNRFTVFLGSISFSLYLTHQYLGLFFLLPWAEVLGIPRFLAVILATSIVCSISYICLRLVEKPSMELVRRWYNNKKTLSA